MRIVERPGRPEIKPFRQTPLHLSVVYTGLTATRVALAKAAQLTRGLNARIRVIVPRAVPYPLPLDNPPVSMRFDRERILALVDSHTNDASVLMCYCRDEVDALDYLLESKPHLFRLNSVIIVAGKKRRWFPTKAQSMAQKLEEAGHRILFVNSAEKQA